jgi:putative spermidine/putrescine transport system permease protein
MGLQIVMNEITNYELKSQLKKVERSVKIRYGLLILPLVIFLLFTFIWPIAELLKRSFVSPEVSAAMPNVSAELKHWDGNGVPSDAVYKALLKDLVIGKGSSYLATAIKRINLEEPGLRTLLSNAARSAKAEDIKDARQYLLSLDSQWGERHVWSAIARGASYITPSYLLAAIDLEIGVDGKVGVVPDDKALFGSVLFRTFWMSFVVSAWCLALGFPVAYFLSTQRPAVANLLMIFVLLPFWTSILVRVASWILILQNEGLLNSLLMYLGLIDSPVQFLFSRFGVYISMIHIMLPFMILPMYSVMKGISPNYMRAAMSLGCSPFVSFLKVYIPQAMPGIGAGSLLVFILCTGYYITPALLGSPKEQMTSYFIAFFTNQTINWGMAAALSAVLLASTTILYAGYSYFVRTQGASKN